MIDERVLAVSQKIDHTNIRKTSTQEDIIKSCQEAKEYKFRGLDVRPEWVSLVKRELEGSDTKTIVLIDPPLGISPHEERLKICHKAKEDGADELDVVMNIVDLKYERYEKILDDLREICQIAPTKVIIGSGYLTDEEIAKASQLVKEAGAICVKTATEKDPVGHERLREKARHLKIMRENAPGLLIKAAVGIRNYDDFKLMVDSGADIIGTSSGVQIVKDFMARISSD